MSFGVVEVTKVRGDGLRYTSKAAGCGDFGFLTSSSGTMSCILCGKHRPRKFGSFKNLAGSRQFVCGECRPVSGKDSH